MSNLNFTSAHLLFLPPCPYSPPTSPLVFSLISLHLSLTHKHTLYLFLQTHQADIMSADIVIAVADWSVAETGLESMSVQGLHISLSQLITSISHQSTSNTTKDKDKNRDKEMEKEKKSSSTLVTKRKRGEVSVVRVVLLLSEEDLYGAACTHLVCPSFPLSLPPHR